MLQRGKPLKRTGGLTRKVPIRPMGRVSRYRQERRVQWVKDHPPNYGDYYICHLCKRPVHREVMKLDHVLPKGSTPKAIAEADENLLPSHEVCNNRKGSTRL